VLIGNNLVFSKWDQIFKDPMTTMAAIDRLVHHAMISGFNGESVRAQKAQGREKGLATSPGVPFGSTPSSAPGGKELIVVDQKAPPDCQFRRRM
jgi:IstB-like ATP binding protein